LIAPNPHGSIYFKGHLFMYDFASKGTWWPSKVTNNSWLVCQHIQQQLFLTEPSNIQNTVKHKYNWRQGQREGPYQVLTNLNWWPKKKQTKSNYSGTRGRCLSIINRDTCIKKVDKMVKRIPGA
jgi:hypothetical protein